jgi:hypothetical protein
MVCSNSEMKGAASGTAYPDCSYWVMLCKKRLFFVILSVFLDTLTVRKLKINLYAKVTHRENLTNIRVLLKGKETQHKMYVNFNQ